MQKLERVTLYGMDCRDAMGLFMAENSVDSIVTDPPYGLGFMGKEWDHGVPGVEFWQRAFDVLKPGGHLLAFSGSRTYHRMVCAIEDAGFEIRDQIMWVYGSGFPKSLDVSKAIDKAAGAEREIIGRGTSGTTAGMQALGPSGIKGGDYNITAPATEAAQQWQGWGTALKPAHEPICVARKPLIGTVAANVLHWGTGALNIDACRVAGEVPLFAHKGQPAANCFSDGLHGSSRTGEVSDTGRWPANLIHDGSDDVLAAFPQAPGQQAAESFTAPSQKTSGIYGAMSRGKRPGGFGDVGAAKGDPVPCGPMYKDKGGSAARFFYCAKSSKKDRDEGLDDAPDRVLAMSNQAKAELARGNMHRGDSGINSAKVRKNNHPTVKPTDLMAYLCRLVTPPGGVVLDPFMGSGSTGKAALREGFRFIGCEMDDGYMAIAAARLAAETGAQV